MSESATIQFRTGVLNISNRANFDIPQNIVNASSFGQVFIAAPVACLASGGKGELSELQSGLWLTS